MLRMFSRIAAQSAAPVSLTCQATNARPGPKPGWTKEWEGGGEADAADGMSCVTDGQGEDATAPAEGDEHLAR